MSITNDIKSTNNDSLSKRKRETIHKHTNSLFSEVCLRYQHRLIKEPISVEYSASIFCEFTVVANNLFLSTRLVLTSIIR